VEIHSPLGNERALDLSPLVSEMVSLATQRRYREAHSLGERLLERHPSSPVLRFQQGRASIATGNWKRGLWLLDSCREARMFGGLPIPTSQPLWSREDLAGKTLLLACEGGLGDAICFSRFAAEFRKLGANVILGGYEPIFDLQAGVRGVEALVDRSVCHRTRFDYWMPALSCPRLLDLELSQIRGEPYLEPPRQTVEKWASLVSSDRLKVGLCWQGNPGFAEDHLRSIPARLFERVMDLPGLSFFKVQVNAENNGLRHGNLTDLTRHTVGPVDLAGFLSQLDLFVTVDSGMAHLAGAMGVPTILLNRIMGWFVFSPAPDHEKLQPTPWYDSVLILHQRSYGRWDDTIECLREILARRQFPSRPQCRTSDRPEDSRFWESASPARTREGPMVVASNDVFVGRALLKYGQYSVGETRLFEAFIGDGQTIIEVGAHIGAHTLTLARLVGPSGRVIALEPQPFLRRLASANLALNGADWAQVMPLAGGDRSGRAELPAIDYSQTDNFGGISLGSETGTPESIAVEVRALDDLGIDSADFIKIDVEGMEREVLLGARRLIQKHRPVLYVEDDRESKSRELRTELGGMGYELFEHRPFLFDPDNFNGVAIDDYPDYVSMNLLAIPIERRDLLERAERLVAEAGFRLNPPHQAPADPGR
jgi:FkbM family methyltransferase